jgi:hypothetical protein
LIKVPDERVDGPNLLVASAAPSGLEQRESPWLAVLLVDRHGKAVPSASGEPAPQSWLQHHHCEPGHPHELTLKLDLIPVDHHVLVLLGTGGPPLNALPPIELIFADLSADRRIRLTGLLAGGESRGNLYVAAEVTQVSGAWRVRAAGYGFDSESAFAAALGMKPDTPLDEIVSPPPPPSAVDGADTDAASAPGHEDEARQNEDVLVPDPAGAPDRADVDTPPDDATRADRRIGPVGAVRLALGGAAEIPVGPSKLTASLNWTKVRKDLDLYALYIDARGKPGICYYRRQGSLKKAPHVCLVSGDSRGAEVIEIGRPDRLRYVLLCAYSAFENGVGSFRSFSASAEVDDNAGSVVTVPLYHDNMFSYWVAIALVDLSQPGRAVISQVETYSRPKSERRPVLYHDGTFAMDRGPVEFKRS